MLERSNPSDCRYTGLRTGSRAAGSGSGDGNIPAGRARTVIQARAEVSRFDPNKPWSRQEALTPVQRSRCKWLAGNYPSVTASRAHAARCQPAI
jgi:hypothetical protein